jgi:energy-coupling factor transporter ATP-binding protein EcfA2
MATKTTWRVKVKKPPKRAGVVSRVTIEGFKSIENAVLDLGLFNVFVGANGSGKSSLFEAIAVLAAAAAGRIDSIELDRRGARLSPIGRYSTHLITAKKRKLMALGVLGQEGGTYEVKVQPPDGSNGTEWNFRNELIKDAEGKILHRLARGGFFVNESGKDQGLPALEPARGFVPSMPLGARPSEAIDRVLGRLTTFRIFEPFTPMLRGVVSEPMANEALGLRGARLAEALEEILTAPGALSTSLLEDHRALIEWSDNVDVTEPTKQLVAAGVPALRKVVRFRDRYMPEGDNYVSAYDASEGALYVLFALVLTGHPRAPRIAAIEHLDHALHPRLARALFRLLTERVKRSGQQLLLSTHHPTSLDGLALSDNDVRLFLVDRTVGGQTVVRRVDYSDALAKAEKSGLTLSQLWVQGSLGGGVPNLW